MLPPNQRIRRKSFQEIFSEGKFFQARNLTLVALKLNKASLSQFAFSVSKKVSKHAVSRNKLRRRGYSVLRNILPAVKPSFQVVFVFKSGAEKLSFGELNKEIVGLLRKAGILVN